MTCRVCGSRMSPRGTDLPFKITDNAIVKGLPVIQCRSGRE